VTELLERVGRVLGASIVGHSRMAGGDINQAACLETDQGRVFLKFHRAAPAGMFVAEAEGLVALAAAGGPRVPEVLGVGEDFLALEWLEPARGQGRDLGLALARLHRAGPGPHGFAGDNWVGTLEQHNSPRESWVDFWREARLGAQRDLAARSGALRGGSLRRLDHLLERLDRWLPAEPPLALLHGDLWGGNWMPTTGGPAIYDPAAYRGDREVDLAMMALFGGFPRETWASYQEALPLEDGATERRGLYQLYPLLVHVNLFGGGYGGQVDGVVRRYVG